MKKIFSTILIILLPTIMYAHTLSSLRTQIRFTINDPSTDTVVQRWHDDQINIVINEAQRQISDDSWCLHGSTEISCITGTTSYALPNDCYAISRVLFNNSNILPQATIGSLDMNQSYWFKQSTGVPINYYWTWNNKIGLYYVPDIPYILDIDYIKEATDMVNDSDIPFDGNNRLNAYHELIVWYASAYLMLCDKKTEATAFLSFYTNGLTRMKNQIGVSPNYGQYIGGKRE